MKKILIIDDDKIFSKILKDGLLAQGDKYSVEVFNSGDEGLSAMQGEVPDLVVLDMLMPEKTGVEVLEEMRKDEKLKDVPVLVGTQLSDVEQMSRAVELGIKGYVIKSELSLDNIIGQVEDALKKAE